MSTQIYNFSSMTIQNSDIKKVLDVKNVSIAMVGLLHAVALVTASSFIKVENDTLTMSMLVAGGVLFIFSLYIIMNNNHKLIYGPTGSTLKHYVVYIDPSQRPAAEKWIDAASANSMASFTKVANSNLRIDAAISSDNMFVAVQLSVYENLRFVPYGDAIYLKGDEAKGVLPLFE